MKMDDVLLFYRGGDLGDGLCSTARVMRHPRLRIDQAWMPELTEANQDLVNFGERCTRRVLVVPFDGEKVVFTLRANRWSSNLPRMLRGTKLTLADVVPPTLAASAGAASVESAPYEQLSRAERGTKDPKNQT